MAEILALNFGFITRTHTICIPLKYLHDIQYSPSIFYIFWDIKIVSDMGLERTKIFFKILISKASTI
jgi:hypothetical protein